MIPNAQNSAAAGSGTRGRVCRGALTVATARAFLDRTLATE